MDRQYFVLWYRLDQRDEYLVWYSDNSEKNSGIDNVLMDEQGRVMSFPDLPALKKWVQVNGLTLVDEKPILHDLDVVQEWLIRPSSAAIDCKEFLNAWNLFTDVKASIEDRNVLGEEKECLDVYDKLFFGNNLLSMTPLIKHYVPNWTDAEIQSLQQILHQELQLFQTCRIAADIDTD